MSNQLFQQNLDDKKGPQPGGPYLIQMLFKEPVDMPDKETMTAVIEKHIGSTECFCYDIQIYGWDSDHSTPRVYRRNEADRPQVSLKQGPGVMEF